jgi:hypothetical protein
MPKKPKTEPKPAWSIDWKTAAVVTGGIILCARECSAPSPGPEYVVRELPAAPPPSNSPIVEIEGMELQDYAQREADALATFSAADAARGKVYNHNAEPRRGEDDYQFHTGGPTQANRPKSKRTRIALPPVGGNQDQDDDE